MNAIKTSLAISQFQIRVTSLNTAFKVVDPSERGGLLARLYRDYAGKTEDEGLQRILLNEANKADRGLPDINGKAGFALQRVVRNLKV